MLLQCCSSMHECSCQQIQRKQWMWHLMKMHSLSRHLARFLMRVLPSSSLAPPPSRRLSSDGHRISAFCTGFLAFLICLAKSVRSLRNFMCCTGSASKLAAIGSEGNVCIIAAFVAALAGAAAFSASFFALGFSGVPVDEGLQWPQQVVFSSWYRWQCAGRQAIAKIVLQMLRVFKLLLGCCPTMADSLHVLLPHLPACSFCQVPAVILFRKYSPHVGAAKVGISVEWQQTFAWTTQLVCVSTSEWHMCMSILHQAPQHFGNIVMSAEMKTNRTFAKQKSTPCS